MEVADATETGGCRQSYRYLSAARRIDTYLEYFDHSSLAMCRQRADHLRVSQVLATAHARELTAGHLALTYLRADVLQLARAADTMVALGRE